MRSSDSCFALTGIPSFSVAGNVVGIELKHDGAAWTVYFGNDRQVAFAACRDPNGHVRWLDGELAVPLEVLLQARAKLDEFNAPSG